MIPPEFPAFPSREIPSGRRYDVHDGTRCIAYGVDDAETLRALGAVDGLVVFAFVLYGRDERPRRLGTWYCAMHADDLLEAMETARAGLDPAAMQPLHRPIGALIEERLRARELLRMDVDVDSSD